MTMMTVIKTVTMTMGKAMMIIMTLMAMVTNMVRRAMMIMMRPFELEPG